MNDRLKQAADTVLANTVGSAGGAEKNAQTDARKYFNDVISRYPKSDEADLAVHAAKSFCAETFHMCAGNMIQLHGGIGMTEELSIGHYFRRLTAFGNLFGDREFHLQRFAALTQ